MLEASHSEKFQIVIGYFRGIFGHRSSIKTTKRLEEERLSKRVSFSSELLGFLVSFWSKLLMN